VKGGRGGSLGIRKGVIFLRRKERAIPSSPGREALRKGKTNRENPRSKEKGDTPRKIAVEEEEKGVTQIMGGGF